MGLGPPVCQHCQVMASYSEKPIRVKRNASTRTAGKYTNWYCEFCGETDPNDHAGMDYTRWGKYKENEKFLRFMLNKEKTS